MPNLRWIVLVADPYTIADIHADTYSKSQADSR